MPARRGHMTDTEKTTAGDDHVPAAVTSQVSVTGAPEHLQLLPGARVPLTLSIQNTGRIVDHFSLTYGGVDPAWVVITTGDATLLPDAEATFELEIRIPDQPVPPAEVYTLRLSVSSRADASAAATHDVAL